MDAVIRIPGFAQGYAEGLVQERFDGFLRARAAGHWTTSALQADLTAYMGRLRPHTHALPLDVIPDAGTLWQTLAQHGGPD